MTVYHLPISDFSSRNSDVVKRTCIHVLFYEVCLANIHVLLGAMNHNCKGFTRDVPEYERPLFVHVVMGLDIGHDRLCIYMQ